MTLKKRLDILLLHTILYVSFFKQIYSYMGVEYVLSIGSSYGYKQSPNGDEIVLIMNIIVLVSLIVLFVIKLRALHCGVGYSIIIFAMITGIVFWTTLVASRINIVQHLHENTAPFVYCTALGIVVGFDNKLFENFIKHIRIIGFASIAISVVLYAQFLQAHYGTLAILGDSAPLVFFVQGFWLICIWCFFSSKDVGNRIYLLLGLMAVLAILFNSRSWIIQTVIWTLAYAYFKDSRNGLLKSVRYIVVIALLTGIVYMIVSYFTPDILENLLEKATRDTRSQQYSDIFEQTTIWNWIFGSGYFFQYYSHLQGGWYSYIDNAYILSLVRYGLSIGLTYPLIYISPVIGIMRKRGIQKEVIPIIMWLLALGGLSIYCAITMDIKCFAIAAAAGRCAYLNYQAENSKIGYTVVTDE